nr:5,10-methylenetetrahydrofolate reductase [Desulfobacterales bacterium]
MGKTFKEALASGKFVITANISSPKGVNVDSLINQVKFLKDLTDGLVVPDNLLATMTMSACAASRLVIENGVDPIMSLNCRDRNRIALASDLLGASLMDIKNILCVSGDHTKFGDHIDAKPVYDIDSVQLLGMARGLEKGRDISHNELNGYPQFCLGAVANPEADPLGPQLNKFDKKVQAGAEFFLTLPVFNIDNLKRFMEHARKSEVKILASIRVLVPEEVHKYADGSYPGLFVPEDVLEEIKDASIDKGIEVAGRLIRDIKDRNICDGINLMASGYEERIPDILKAGGI